jgi:hypothetical protein
MFHGQLEILENKAVLIEVICLLLQEKIRGNAK